MFEKIISAFSNVGLMIPEFILLFLLFFFVMYVLKDNNAQLLNYLFCAFVVITGIVFVFVDGLNNFPENTRGFVCEWEEASP